MPPCQGHARPKLMPYAALDLATERPAKAPLPPRAAPDATGAPTTAASDHRPEAGSAATAPRPARPPHAFPPPGRCSLAAGSRGPAAGGRRPGAPAGRGRAAPPHTSPLPLRSVSLAGPPLAPGTPAPSSARPRGPGPALRARFTTESGRNPPTTSPPSPPPAPTLSAAAPGACLAGPGRAAPAHTPGGERPPRGAAADPPSRESRPPPPSPRGTWRGGGGGGGRKRGRAGGRHPPAPPRPLP